MMAWKFIAVAALGLSALALAWRGKDGWGWFLLVAVLIGAAP